MGRIIMYVGDRRTGKTTRLLQEFNKFSIVLDCATEHPQCSLICKIRKLYPNLIPIRWKHIFFRKPRKLLNNIPLLFDTSFFLERAHDIPILSPILIFLYHIHVHLILYILSKWILRSDLPFKIILDEIKMSLPTQKLLLTLVMKKPNVDLIVAVHKEKYAHYLAKKTRIVHLQQKFE